MKTIPALAMLVLGLSVNLFAAPMPPAQAGGDAAFAKLTDDFLKGYLDWRPLAATMLGLHEYDGKITDFSRGSLDAELARLKSFERRLAEVPPASLSRERQFDLQILLAGIRTELFHFQEMATYTRNPMTYAGVLDLNIYAKRDFAPAADRLRSIVAIERKAPGIFADARANLEPTLPKPYVETAIEMAKGAAEFFSKDMVNAFKGVGDAKLQEEFRAANGQAVKELQDFGTWLEKEKLPGANAPYALGRPAFEKMLRETELIDWPAERLLALGLKQLKREQKVFADTARIIDPKTKPIEVFKAIQKDHPTEQSLIPDTRRDLEAIRQFVIDHKIVTVPSEVRARVEETPEYLRATSFASMDTPGPFETKATEAYYYVTPVEADWTPKQKDEWLTAFNYYTTDIVSIHESYPGHYVQFLWLKAAPPSRVASIFSSYCYVEGWAHYCEQMVVDEGYGAAQTSKPAPDQIVRAAKYRLAQSDEALLRVCRLCVSIKTHCEGMPLEEAARFFQDNCYYEKQSAYEEARRGTFDPQYLLYTLGKLQFLKLRSDMRKQEGKAFVLEQFHNQLLVYGMPPIPLLRQRLLKDPKIWNALF